MRTRDAIKYAKSQGFIVEEGSKHYKVKDARGRLVTLISRQPRLEEHDPHFLRNVLRRWKRDE